MKKNYFDFKGKSLKKMFLSGMASAVMASGFANNSNPPVATAMQFFNQEDYVSFTVNGFNEDVIINGVGDFNLSTTTGIDNGGYCFLEVGTQLSAEDDPTTYGLPTNGVLNSSSVTDLSFQLAPYNNNNVLRITDAGEANAMSVDFDEIGSYDHLYFAVTGGSNAVTFSGTINFEDGTTQEFESLVAPDWYQTGDVIVQGLGRGNRETNVLESSTVNPKIFQLTIAIDVANQSKSVTGITVQKDEGGYLNLFAVSGKLAADCPSPSAITTDVLNPTNATISWTGYDEGESYEVAIVEAGEDALTTGVAVATNSYQFTELTSETAYDVYLRTVCAVSGNSYWVGPYSLTTPCAAATSIDESFENEEMPGCWSVINDGGTYTWGLFLSASYAHTGIRSMRIRWNTNAHDDFLITPPFTVVDHVSDYINFWARSYNAYSIEEFNVLVSTTGNAKEDFTDVIASNVMPGGSYEEFEYDLSAYEGQTVYVAIQAVSANEFYLYVDDIKTVGEPTCFVPENLSVTEVEAYTASVNWDAGENTDWEIAYVENGEDAPESGIAVAEATYDFSELTPNTAYTVYLRANCGEVDGYSEWVTVNFTTPVSCQVPVDAAVSEITTTTATFTWAAAAENQTSWEVAYDLAGEEAPLSGEELTTTTYALSELSPSTAYTIYLRANCGDVDGYSEWIEISFSTACGATTAINESFEYTNSGDLANCWSDINVSGTASWGVYSLSVYANTGSKSMRLWASQAQEDYLISPALELTAHENDVFSFYARKNSTLYASNFDIKVSTTGTDQDDFTDTIVAGVSTNTTHTYYEYDLSAYDGETIYIAIVGHTPYSGALYIDDVLTSASEFCSAPVNLVANNISPTSATLSWEDQEGASWEIAVQEQGTGEPTSAGTLVTSTTYDATFTMGTVSEFYVRTLCDDGVNYSAWSGPFAFGGYMPLEITGGQTEDVIANGTGDASASTTTDVDGVNWALRALDYKATETDEALLEGLPMNRVISSDETAGLVFKLSDYNENNSLRLPEVADNGTLTVAASQPAEKLYLAVNSGNGNTFISGTINFTDGTSQSITSVIAPKWYNSADQPTVVGGIGRVSIVDNTLQNPSGNPRIYQIEVLIDEVHQSKIIESIELQKDSGGGVTNIYAASIKYSSYAASVADVALNTATVYPNPVKDRLHISGVEATNVAVYNMLGQQVKVTFSNNTVDMSALEKGVYLVNITAANGTKTVRVVKE